MWYRMCPTYPWLGDLEAHGSEDRVNLAQGGRRGMELPQCLWSARQGHIDAFSAARSLQFGLGDCLLTFLQCLLQVYLHLICNLPHQPALLTWQAAEVAQDGCQAALAAQVFAVPRPGCFSAISLRQGCFSFLSRLLQLLQHVRLHRIRTHMNLT